MKSVLLLGASSMLGREVGRQLASDGVRVIRAGRGTDNEVIVNLGVPASLKFSDNLRADVLIHCAAAFGDDSEGGRSENLQVNIGGCAQALTLASRAGVRKIVYAGSVFSARSRGESDRSYSFSKAEAERILEWYASRANLQFCSLRFGQLWDTDGRCCLHQPWFGRIVAYASRGQLLRMPPCQGMRNFMHVSDAAKLLIHAAKSDCQGVYDACHPENVDMYLLARGACDIFDAGGSVEVDLKKAPIRRINFPLARNVFVDFNLPVPIGLPQGLALIRDAGTAHLFGPMDVM